jgi:hypothetical protein
MIEICFDKHAAKQENQYYDVVVMYKCHASC